VTSLAWSDFAILAPIRLATAALSAHVGETVDLVIDTRALVNKLGTLP
jgi:hypothetical protein